MNISETPNGEEQVLSPSVIVWYNLILVKRIIYSDLNCHESGYEGKRLDGEKKERVQEKKNPSAASHLVHHCDINL